MKEEFSVTPGEDGQRLDLVCTRRLNMISRARVQRAIKDGSIIVNGKIKVPGYTVRIGDIIIFSQEIPQETITEEEKLPSIPIIFEDRDVVVVNKPAGIVIHEGTLHRSQTLVSWLIDRYPAIKNRSHEFEGPVGIIHRLDKDTSGVMICAKTPQAQVLLRKQFLDRRVKKEYLALVYGALTMTQGRITQPLARSKRNPMRRTIDPEGKPAITEWKREEVIHGIYTLLRVFPFTGRIHQIRAHLHFIGHPIVGDHLYVYKRKHPPKGVKRQMLHAERLTLALPSGKRKTFIAPLAEDFVAVLDGLR